MPRMRTYDVPHPAEAMETNHNFVGMEIKCPSCHDWLAGQPHRCTSCGYDFLLATEGRKNSFQPTKEPFVFEIPLIPMDPDDAMVVKFLKYAVRSFQFLAMAFASGMAWMAYWIAV